MGRHAEAIALSERAVAAAPSSVPARLALGWSHLYAREPEKAAAVCNGIGDLSRSITLQAADCLMNAHAALGQEREALGDVRRLATALEHPPAAMEKLEELSAVDGIAGLWRWRLVDLEEQLASHPGSANEQAIAVFNARLHRLDRASGALQRAAARRASVVVFLRVHPAFESLHGDPRFEDLAAQVGLPRPGGRGMAHY
jgi:hypothetical protein